MKTIELASVEEMRKVIDERVWAGDVLHGSPVLDLDVLRSSKSASLRVHVPSNQQIENKDAVHGTCNRVSAVFYAAVHACVREAGLARGSGMKLVRRNGVIVGTDYFLSDSGKALIRQRLEDNVRSAVYFCDGDDFAPLPDSDELVAESGAAVRVLGSVAVSTLHLPFDIFSLPSPDSDPDIHEYYERAGVPPEN